MDSVLIFLPIVLLLVVLVIPSFAVMKYFDFKNRKRESPLNRKLLRNPGHTLCERIDGLTKEIMENFIIFLIISICIYNISEEYYLLQKNGAMPALFLGIFFMIGLTIYFYVKNFNILEERNKLRLAYECELIVGQQLQNTLINGFKIFHDFPAEKFNIDHIAIGPSGVFAIETKGRAKFTKKEKRNWEVKFDGRKLKFPGWEEDEPILQTKRQATWLCKWIREATGEEVRVVPVLALPGWYVDLQYGSDVVVYNGMNPYFLAKYPASLTESQVRIIANQIENMCRDVEKKSYKKMI